MTFRVYVVGTDTSVGKTTVVCNLVRHARDEGLHIVPFKPAQSGAPGPQSDADRLLRAAGLAPDERPTLCPLHFDAPLAPGLADDRRRFVDRSPPSPDLAPLKRADDALATLERRLRPDVLLIEGAGGLHVPMPGGTWQPMWIERLCRHTLVVGRAGLGTISHTLLTIDALRRLARPPIAFVLSTVSAHDDVSRLDNAAVISAARDLPHLGTLPHAPTDADSLRDASWLASDAWSRLAAAP